MRLAPVCEDQVLGHVIFLLRESGALVCRDPKLRRAGQIDLGTGSVERTSINRRSYHTLISRLQDTREEHTRSRVNLVECLSAVHTSVQGATRQHQNNLVC